MKTTIEVKKVVSAIASTLKKAVISFFNFFKRHKGEIILILNMIIIFILSPVVIKLLPQFNDSYDNGYIQRIIFSGVYLTITMSFVHIIMYYLWGSVNEYLATGWTTDFRSLTPWQKIVTSLVISLSFMLFMVLVRM